MKKYTRKTRLHKLLDKVRMTQKMFSSEVGVEASAVSLWLAGKRLPTDANVQLMSRILQVEPVRLKAIFIAENLYDTYGQDVCKILASEIQSIADEWKETNDAE